MIVSVFRIRSLFVLVGFVGLAAMMLVVVLLPGVVAAQEDDPTGGPTGVPTVEPTGDPVDEDAAAAGGECVATGYLVGSGEELSGLRGELVDRSVHEVGGVPLVSGQTWVVPDGSQPVVVLDSTVPLSGGSVSVSLAGQSFEAGSQVFEEPSHTSAGRPMAARAWTATGWPRSRRSATCWWIRPACRSGTPTGSCAPSRPAR